MTAAKTAHRRNELLGIMGESIVQKTIVEPGANTRRRSALQALCGRCCRSLFHALAIAPLLISAAAPAQVHSAAYRRTVLSIQELIEANKLDDAHTALAAAQRQYPNDGGLDNLLGVIEIEQGNAEGARQSFAAAVRHDPALASACMNLSRIDMRSAEKDSAARSEALALSEKVLRLEPSNDEARYQIATILAWGKSYRRSLDYLARLSPDARIEIGAEDLTCSDEASLDAKDATTKAAVALASNPDLTEQDADTCRPALLSAHRADLIETIFRAAGSRHPLSSAGLRTLGLALEAEGRLADARSQLEQAYSADPASVSILEDLVRVARAAKDDLGALGYLAHARDLQPKDPSLPYRFGVICLQMGLYGESRKALEEAVRLAPDDPTYNLGLGIVISYSNDPSQALPYLTKYQSLRPQDPAGKLAMGETYYRAKDYDQAAAWLQQVIDDVHSAPEAYFYLGCIERQDGHTDQAVEELKHSLAASPDQPDALAELGQIYVETRDFAQAATYLNRAVALDHDNYAANFGLLELYARTGDPRRDRQSSRFDEIKNKRDQLDRDMMRVLEIRKDGESSNSQ
jgi:tetratricopeptide (TPR) repeat protein